MPAPREDFEGRLKAAKQASTGQLLLRAARRFNETAVEHVRASGRPLRISHTHLFPHIDLEGTRLTELAARIGISKQAVGQLVAELEAEGLLRRVPDPSDGRARLVRFTARGRRSLLEGLSLMSDIEERVQAEMGERRMADLRRGLVALLSVLDAEPVPEPAPRKPR